MRLQDVLDSVLTAARSGFGGVGEPAAPARVGLVHRPEGPTWDCDLLAVTLSRIYPSRVGTITDIAPQKIGVRFVADVTATIVRCGAPTLDDAHNSPTAAQLNTFAETMVADAQALWGGLVDAWGAKSLVPSGCGPVTFGELRPLSPRGGLAGWAITLTVALD